MPVEGMNQPITFFLKAEFTPTVNGGLVEAEIPYDALMQVYPWLNGKVMPCEEPDAEYTVVRSSSMPSGGANYFRKVTDGNNNNQTARRRESMMFNDMTAKAEKGVLKIGPFTLLNYGPDKMIWNFRAGFTGKIDHYNVERQDPELGWYKVNCRLQHHAGGPFLTCNDPSELDRVIWEGYNKLYARYAGP